jgi:chromosome segregation protein
MSNLDWAKAFFNDAPPAKLAVYSPQILADQPLAALVKAFHQPVAVE